MPQSYKPRLLTGDTPTGKLHLGHWVGSLENRVQLQNKYDCYFLIANPHAFSTKAEKPQEIRDSVLDIVCDYLAVGISPEQSCIFLESDIPAIFELATYFSMLISYPRLMRNPTIKDEIRDKNLSDQYSMGFLWYPILQVSDILTFLPEVVPVGEDQIPHLELTREVARKFNSVYCEKEDGLFPIIQPLLGRTKRLVGLGGPNAQGNLLKMSKSFNNAILLSDTADIIKQKVMGIYTDPNRIRVTDPGTVENNPLWIFHDVFNSDKKWVEQAKERYRAGTIGDVECKRKLIDVLVEFISPISQKRANFAKNPDYILEVLRKGAEKANCIANNTLTTAKTWIRQIY